MKVLLTHVHIVGKVSPSKQRPLVSIVSITLTPLAQRAEAADRGHEPKSHMAGVIDGIISRKHAIPTSLHNLALACFHCNRHKEPNIAGRDSVVDLNLNLQRALLGSFTGRKLDVRGKIAISRHQMTLL